MPKTTTKKAVKSTKQPTERMAQFKRVMKVMADGRKHTVASLAKIPGILPGRMSIYMCEMKRAPFGAKIKVEKDGQRVTSYQIENPAKIKPIFQKPASKKASAKNAGAAA